MNDELRQKVIDAIAEVDAELFDMSPHEALRISGEAIPAEADVAIAEVAEWIANDLNQAAVDNQNPFGSDPTLGYTGGLNAAATRVRSLIPTEGDKT